MVPEVAQGPETTTPPRPLRCPQGGECLLLSAAYRKDLDVGDAESVTPEARHRLEVGIGTIEQRVGLGALVGLLQDVSELNGIAKLTPNGRNAPTGLHSNGHCPIPRPKRPLAQPPIMIR